MLPSGQLPKESPHSFCTEEELLILNTKQIHVHERGIHPTKSLDQISLNVIHRWRDKVASQPACSSVGSITDLEHSVKYSLLKIITHR